MISLVGIRGVIPDTMHDFRQISGLHCGAGAADGTFMRIRKPREWGDHYWWYKQYLSLCLYLGDVFTCNNSQPVKKAEEHRLLNEQIRKVGNTFIGPYVVGDSAFAQSQTLVKGFPYPPAPANMAFNAAVVSARKIVE